MFQQSVDRRLYWQTPFDRAAAAAKWQLDVVCCEMQKQTVRAAHGFEQIKEHFHGMLSRNIRIKQWQAVVTSDVSDRELD